MSAEPPGGNPFITRTTFTGPCASAGAAKAVEITAQAMTKRRSMQALICGPPRITRLLYPCQSLLQIRDQIIGMLHAYRDADQCGCDGKSLQLIGRHPRMRRR